VDDGKLEERLLMLAMSLVIEIHDILGDAREPDCHDHYWAARAVWPLVGRSVPTFDTFRAMRRRHRYDR